MLSDHQVMLAYPFESYWKDVGTIASLWEANMDLLKVPPEFDLNDSRWKIYARSPIMPPHFIGSNAVVERSMIAEGCEVNGSVRGSVLFAGVCVEDGALIEDSVIMPNTVVKSGAIIRRAIVAENCVIGKNAIVGAEMGDITLIGQDTQLPENYTVAVGDQVDTDIIKKREAEAQ